MSEIDVVDAKFWNIDEAEPILVSGGISRPLVMLMCVIVGLVVAGSLHCVQLRESGDNRLNVVASRSPPSASPQILASANAPSEVHFGGAIEVDVPLADWQMPRVEPEIVAEAQVEPEMVPQKKVETAAAVKRVPVVSVKPEKKVPENLNGCQKIFQRGVVTRFEAGVTDLTPQLLAMRECVVRPGSKISDQESVESISENGIVQTNLRTLSIL